MPTKGEVCAICVERTRGKTVKVDLGRGVQVWLCQDHASDEFRRRRSGRDFVLTLHRLWFHERRWLRQKPGSRSVRLECQLTDAPPVNWQTDHQPPRRHPCTERRPPNHAQRREQQLNPAPTAPSASQTVHAEGRDRSSRPPPQRSR